MARLQRRLDLAAGRRRAAAGDDAGAASGRLEVLRLRTFGQEPGTAEILRQAHRDAGAAGQQHMLGHGMAERHQILIGEGASVTA